MKKTIVLYFIILITSCTSNTIFKKPKDLIPKDTMSLLIQDMMIASSAKFVKTKKLEKNINYMPFVYDKFKIDSLRFQESNLYYVSKIDVYFEIISNAKNSLEKRKDSLTKYSSLLDSIKRDSINKAKIPLTELDSMRTNSVKNPKMLLKELDTMLLDSLSLYYEN